MSYVFDLDNRLQSWLGDCLDLLKIIPDSSIDCIITDPPFAMAGGISNGRRSQTDSQFFELWLVTVFKELYRVSKPEAAWVFWGDWRTSALYDTALQKASPNQYDARWVSQIVIHDREMVGMGSPFRNQTDWLALVRGPKTDFSDRIPKNQPNVIRSYWYYGKHDNHPSEKDPKIARKLVEWLSDENEIILDCFMGSGTTGVAALEAGRRFVGIEKEESYFAVADSRLNETLNSTGLIKSVAAPTLWDTQAS